MSDPKNGLDAIHTLLVSTAEKIGDMHGRLHHVEADVAAVRVASISQGQVLAQLQQTCASRGVHCERRFKRISQDVGIVREDTGVIELEQARRKTIWWTVAKIAAALLALAGLVTGALGALRSCAGVAEVKAKIEKRQTVRVKLLDQPWCLSELAELRGVLEQRLPHGEWMKLATSDVPWPKWR